MEAHLVLEVMQLEVVTRGRGGAWTFMMIPF